jgi:exodeoxyribonuclease-3
MKIISWNVNGLRSAYKKGFLDWLEKEIPDIVCIQETKADKIQLPPELHNVKGYLPFFVSASKKGYSGVALYTKQKPEKIEYGLGIERFDHEGRVIIAYYKEFILYNIYFPNGKASRERLEFKMDFYDAFLDLVLKKKNQGNRIIICGDVNTAHKEIDLARPKENEDTSGFLPEERAWIDKLTSNGFADTLRVFNKDPGQYTWWDLKTRARERNVGWRIDYFFVSENLTKNLKSSFIQKDVTGSDHCPIGIEINL